MIRFVMRSASILSLIILFIVIAILTLTFSHEAAAMTVAADSGQHEQNMKHSQTNGEQKQKHASTEMHAVTATDHGNEHVNLGKFLPL